MTIACLDNRTARKVFLDRHALAEQPTGSAQGEALLGLICRLGFVQLDSINTVARAHDMTLFSRRQTYRPKNLKRLYENDRALFEHWTHDAAMIPMEFYPHWQIRFRRDADKLKKQWRNWRRDGFENRFDQILEHIRDFGPVCSSDVGKEETKSNGGWWDWHPSKTALEYLWRSGALTVVGRDGFQKRYDLTERVIDTLADVPDPEQSINWLCNEALDRLGFATSGEIAAFWATVTAQEAKEWCEREHAAGNLILINVTCHDGKLRRSYARPDILDHASKAPIPPKRIRVLSPFDPALRNRDRTQRLFGFHYRIEIFVPEKKRKFGYYVFPLLEGDRLIGRVDMKADRGARVLFIKAVWPEHGVVWSDARNKRLLAELERVRRFTDLDEVGFADGWLQNPVCSA